MYPMVGAGGTESATALLLGTAAGRELLGRLADRDVIADTFRPDTPASVRDHGRPAHVVGVDADLTALAFARHNAAVCAPGASAGFVCADVTQSPLGGLDAVFIDPARRQ